MNGLTKEEEKVLEEQMGSYNKLCQIVIKNVVDESLKNYREGKDNSKNEAFLMDDFMVKYQLPNLPGELIIEMLKGVADYEII